MTILTISNRNRGAKPKCRGRFSATAVILVTIPVVGFPAWAMLMSRHIFKAGEYPLVRSRWPGVSDDPITHFSGFSGNLHVVFCLNPGTQQVKLIDFGMATVNRICKKEAEN